MFELGKDPLEEPMKALRRFLEPRISRACIARDKRRESGELPELDSEELHLLDRLAEASEGERAPCLCGTEPLPRILADRGRYEAG